MPRSVNMPLRWVVRTTAPLKVVAIAFCRPQAMAAPVRPDLVAFEQRNGHQQQRGLKASATP